MLRTGRKREKRGPRLGNPDPANGIDMFANNLPANPTPAQAEVAKRVKSMWDEYVKTTLRVAALSLENSNEQARRLSMNMDEYWDSIDDDITELVTQNSNTRALVLYSTDGQRQETELNQYTDQMLADSARLQEEAIAHVTDPVRNAPGGRPSSSEPSGGGRMKMLPPSVVIPLGEDDDF